MSKGIYFLSLILVVFITACGSSKEVASSAQTPDIRTSFVNGEDVTYEVINGLAIFEGDIILGPVETISSEISTQATGFLDGTNKKLWTGGIVPYTIDSNVNTATIQNAIADWENKTPIRFIPKRITDTSYVRFARGTTSSACFSQVGRQSGEQKIELSSSGDCGIGATIHEIGHAVGYWHEQARCDRNNFVTILWSNINPTYKYAFDNNCEAQAENTIGIDGQRNRGNGVDLGAYDINSIMHYGPFDFSINSQPAIQSKSGATVGSATGQLSQKDADGVWLRYGYTAPCTSCKLNSTGTMASGTTAISFALPRSGNNLKIWLEGPKGSSANFNLAVIQTIGDIAVQPPTQTLASSQNSGAFEYISLGSWTVNPKDGLTLKIQNVGSSSGSYRIRAVYNDCTGGVC